jgi:hypothetical protein
VGDIECVFGTVLWPILLEQHQQGYSAQFAGKNGKSAAGRTGIHEFDANACTQKSSLNSGTGAKCSWTSTNDEHFRVIDYQCIQCRRIQFRYGFERQVGDDAFWREQEASGVFLMIHPHAGLGKTTDDKSLAGIIKRETHLESWFGLGAEILLGK